MGNIFVVTIVSTLLIITRVSSGLKKIANVNLSGSDFINGKCLTLYSPSGLPLRLSSLTEDT